MVKATHPPRKKRPDDRLDLALDYATKGYAVFPLRPGSKKPAVGNGQNEATTDEATVRAWWTDMPNANIGISARASGLVVVDIDTKTDDGRATWARATAGRAIPEPEFVVLTPSGGEHRYYQHDYAEAGISNSAGKLAVGPGVDIRANGYVVAPGSYTEAEWSKDGSRLEAYPGYYRVAPPDADDETVVDFDLPPVRDVHVATRDLVTTATTKKTSERAEHHETTSSGQPLGELGQHAALVRETIELATMGPDSGRNERLNISTMKLAQIVAGGGVLTREMVYGAMKEACTVNGLIDEDGLESVDATFESGWSKGTTEPRLVDGGTTTDASGFEGRLLDIGSWLTEDHPIPERFGMGGILYTEGLHWVAGEPESGKSVLAYQWALDAALAGKRALILDEEAGERDALGKLVALEPRTELWASRIDYLPPTGWDLMVNAASFRQFVLDRGVSVIVVDSAATALAGAGIEENENGPVLRFINAVLIPLAKEHGLCVVVIDHKTKTNSDSRWARGAGSKLGAVDVQISVTASTPFSRDRNGVVKVVCDKDRFGVHGRGHTWRVDVAVGDGTILPSALDMGFEEKGTGKPDLGTPEPLILLAQAVVAKTGRPMSKTKVRDAVKAQAKVGSTKAHSAVDEAIRLGLLVRADDGENWVPAPNGNGASDA
ncbi:bifunctional DNA primase/polymerase [Kocuria kalidii]|uniref:bifunctional DNA primase/polymerase n=1 Tax=Kocuria kalidii TaxID=3376283 RepID=UPI00379A89F8